MDTVSEKKINDFIAAISVLYKAFFRSFPFLKPIIVNAILYSSGNYGLVVTDEGRALKKYTVFQSTDGPVVMDGIDESANVCFNLQSDLIDDIIHNKETYKSKPYKLMKYFFTYMGSISIRDNSLSKSALYGKKVILRPGEQGDITYLLRWYNDEELNRLAGWSNSKVTAQRLMYNMSRSFGYDPMNLMIDDERGKPIGTIQLYDFSDQDKSCKLGIRIGDSDYWSQGYGQDSVNTIVDYAFSKLDMFRVSLKVYEYNERALNCYKKCGFVLEGKTRKSACIDGKFFDEYIMGILKSDFIAQKYKNRENKE